MACVPRHQWWKDSLGSETVKDWSITSGFIRKYGTLKMGGTKKWEYYLTKTRRCH